MIRSYGAGLVVSGIRFGVDDFLKITSIKPLTVYHAGNMVIGPDQTKVPRTDSGFIYIIPCDETKPLKFHIQAAIETLKKLKSVLMRAPSLGADDLRINFFYPQLDVPEQSVYLPPDLLKIAGELGIGIELSAMQYEHYSPPR